MNLNLIVRRVSLIAAAALTMAGAAQAAGVPSNKGAGVNLSGFDYWSPDFPLINQFKRAGGWLTQCSYPQDASCTNFANGASGWDTLEQSKMKVDAEGYPTSLPAANDNTVKYRRVSGLMFHNDSRVHPAGKYIVLYEGAGTIEYSMSGSKVASESKPGRDVVTVTNNTNDGMLLTISATDPNNHLRNIRVLPPGGVCSGDQAQFALTSEECAAKGKGSLIAFENLKGRVWHPSFVADLKGFRQIRFLDWNRTNSSPLANWLDRPRVDDAMWSGPAGVPVNMMVNLANEVGADPWINLPMRATDDYAARWARQLKGLLAPKLNLIVEYSNEPWNYAFPAANWMKDQAAAKWPDQIAKGVSPYTLQSSWYGMRAAQLCKIVKAEFGADASRVKCVMGGFAQNAWTSAQEMDCPYAQAEVGQACYKNFDALAIAPYFGAYIGDMAYRGYVKTWYTDSDGGLSKLFQELLGQDANGNKVTPPLYGKAKDSYVDGAVAQAKTWMQSNKNEATNRGLPLVSYEGGQHLIMGNGDNDQQWLNLITAANRDSRMGIAYSRHLQDWQAVGGQQYTLFNHLGQPSKYGAWGLKETQYQNSNPKWQAILPYKETKDCWWANCQR